MLEGMAEGTAEVTGHDDGRGAVVPVLVYEDIQAAHDDLVSTFGFTSGGLHRGEDATVVHGEVRLGNGVVWLHRAAPEHQLVSPRDAAVSHGGLSVLVPDVDAHFERARAAGAHIEREPADQDYGLREYGARDVEGHRWWFASPLPG
jgi:MerR family transcriptional regulator, thiopeptide resistance regulator